MRLRVVAVAAPLGWSVVNGPPSSTLPSACKARLETVLFALGSKPVSSVPSALSRAMRVRVVAVAAPLGWRVVKPPPISTLPSACTIILETPPFALGSKPMSSVPSALSRAMRLRVVAVAAPLGWRVVKLPPISTLPSACTAKPTTAVVTTPLLLTGPPPARGSKPMSSVPSALSRAILLRGTPSTEVKMPEMMVLPSGCTAVP